MKILEQMFLRRPRILNYLHAARLAGPTSQTVESELQSVAKYSSDAKVALEIGSSQGVSAARIAAAMPRGGILYCVDPWPPTNGKMNPCYSIFARHMQRSGVAEKIRILQHTSDRVTNLVPGQLDFIFVDGDHSWTGIETDWRLVQQKLRVGGIVCLHDVLVPASEPWRQLGSVEFYRNVIASDRQFEIVDSVHSLAALRRNA